MSIRYLTVIVLLCFLSGCRRAGMPRPATTGYVDLSVLEQLHPAWPQRDSLTALIASAHLSHQHPIPPFRVPPDPSLRPAPLQAGAAGPAEREQMERVIQARIDRDLAAVQDKVEREVARFRETEMATAERESRLRAEESEPEFHEQYAAVARRWADKIAPLRLEEVGLLPHFTDAALLSPERARQRAARLAVVRQEIDRLRGQRDDELAQLQREHQVALKTAREQRLAEAESAVRRYREQRLGALAATRKQQQAQIQADLERSLRMQITLPEIHPPLPGATAEAARRRAAATSESAAATMERYHEEARDVEHKLYVQREELERLIAIATRTAVLQIARRHNIDVQLTPSSTGRNLTPLFAAWLRQRWPASGVQAFRRSGVQVFRNRTPILNTRNPKPERLNA